MKETLQKIVDKKSEYYTLYETDFQDRSSKDIQKEKVVKKYNLKDNIV